MHTYLTAYAEKAEAARQHETHFGRKTFRVLTVTTDHYRAESVIDALRQINIPESKDMVVVTQDGTPASKFSAPINPSPNETTAPSATLNAPLVSPSGQKEYRNDHYRFQLSYPDSMEVSEYKEWRHHHYF